MVWRSIIQDAWRQGDDKHFKIWQRNITKKLITMMDVFNELWVCSIKQSFIAFLWRWLSLPALVGFISGGERISGDSCSLMTYSCFFIIGDVFWAAVRMWPAAAFLLFSSLFNDSCWTYHASTLSMDLSLRVWRSFGQTVSSVLIAMAGSARRVSF